MEAAPCWELGFRGKTVVQEGFVNLTRGVGLREIRETRDFAGSDEFLRRPDVVGRGLSEEIRLVEVLGLLNCFEIPSPREPGEVHEILRAVLLRQPTGFSVFLA